MPQNIVEKTFVSPKITKLVKIFILKNFPLYCTIQYNPYLVHTSFAESSVSECFHICSVCTTTQAVGTAIRRGQKVYCALD